MTLSMRSRLASLWWLWWIPGTSFAGLLFSSIAIADGDWQKAAINQIIWLLAGIVGAALQRRAG